MDNVQDMLRLVVPQNTSRAAHFQRVLFPDSGAQSFLFVELPLRSGKEFLQIVENACPRLIVDLRSVPRFNFDLLTRESVFDAFAKAKCIYVDSELPAEQKSATETWRQLFQKHRTLAALKEGRALGPCMFLFNHDGDMPRFEEFLMNELPESRERAWSVFYITSGEEFALKKFTK